MAENIILSSSVRNNLLSLQNTARLLETTQNHLATGLKVNSALDDPSAFFTASSLNSRASDLNRLLDDVGLAVQTLEAADKGIGAITDLVEAAQAAARNALQAAASSGGTAGTAATVTGTGAALDADAPAVVTGTADAVGASADLETGFTITDGDSITINGTEIELGSSHVNTGTDLQTAINNISGVVASFNGDGQLVITSDDADTDIVISGDASALTGLGLTAATTAATNLLSQGISQGETLTITVGANATQTVTFGTGAGEVSTIAELQTALGALGGSNGIAAGATVDANGNLSVAADNTDDSIVIGGDADVTAFGVAAGTTEPTAGTTGTNATRTAAENEFNNLLTQINDLAADASFNGNNLLTGDDLTVIFNEDGSSSLDISGVTFTSAGLGINQAATDSFQSNANIDVTLAELDTAISTLRTQAATFGSNLSVVQIRQDFTGQLIDVLETGAGNLTLADTNREGANLLALQTRQQLSSTSLGIAARADQAVLQLLR